MSRLSFLRPDSAPLVCVVGTVRDTPDNVRRFVQSNLRAGADHVFVFIDDASAEVHAALAEEPHVTPVRAGPRYWRGARPQSLKVRQQVNANLINVALTELPDARWLFHVDADECLHLDRARLLALADDVRTVQLMPWEAVSQMRWDGPVTLYKRPIEEDSRTLLTQLGVLKDPPTLGYLRGNRRGRTGVRPALDLRLSVRRAERLDGRPVRGHEGDWLHVLHDEWCSGEEILRRWRADRAPVNGGTAKQQLYAAVTAVVTNATLGDQDKQALLTELYQRHVRDDAETLDMLGLLERPAPDWHQHKPRHLRRKEMARLHEVLEQLRVADKVYFMCGPKGRPPGELMAGSASAFRA